MNNFQFIIEKGEDGKFYLASRTEFEYKEQNNEVISRIELNDYKEGNVIPEATQRQLMEDMSREINEYKLKN